MRILTNNKDHEETFDVIPTHIENILFYNDDLLESGEQYSSVGDGLFKFKSIAGEMIEIYMDHMKISVYFDKFIIKYKNCYYNY